MSLGLLDRELQKITKFGLANARTVKVLIEGNALIPPSNKAVRDLFLQDGWVLSSVTIQSPPSAYFRNAQVLIVAEVYNQYSDTAIKAKARELMQRFLNVNAVKIIKSSDNSEDILEADDNDFLKQFGIGLGLSTGTLVILAVAGLIIYKKKKVL